MGAITWSLHFWHASCVFELHIQSSRSFPAAGGCSSPREHGSRNGPGTQVRLNEQTYITAHAASHSHLHERTSIFPACLAATAPRAAPMKMNPWLRLFLVVLILTGFTFGALDLEYPSILTAPSFKSRLHRHRHPLATNQRRVNVPHCPKSRFGIFSIRTCPWWITVESVPGAKISTAALFLLRKQWIPSSILTANTFITLVTT